MSEKIVRARFRDLRISHGLLLVGLLFAAFAHFGHFPDSASDEAVALALVLSALVLVPRFQPVLVITEGEVAIVGRRPQRACRAEIAAIRVSLESVRFVNQQNVPLISFWPGWYMPKYRGLADTSVCRCATTGRDAAGSGTLSSHECGG